MFKDGFKGKYIEFDFSENLALRPKVHSAHFSGKQHTVPCEDTKHDPVFVNGVLQNLMHQYNINNEHVMIQSDNAAT